jgi:hypothetical protein
MTHETCVKVQVIDQVSLSESRIPSGKRLHNYGKSPFIVDLPMKNGDFP